MVICSSVLKVPADKNNLLFQLLYNKIVVKRPFFTQEKNTCYACLMNIGHRIKELMESRGLIQKDFARKIGVSVQAVSAWETGVRNPNATQRQKLCEFFGISEPELFGGRLSGRDIDPETLAALQDTVAVKALLVTHKSNPEIKNSIKVFLDNVPHMSAEKRQAILTLCK
jgi:transcriptional regulator with XRE-family HTH domain